MDFLPTQTGMLSGLGKKWSVEAFENDCEDQRRELCWANRYETWLVWGAFNVGEDWPRLGRESGVDVLCDGGSIEGGEDDAWLQSGGVTRLKMILKWCVDRVVGREGRGKILGRAGGGGDGGGSAAAWRWIGKLECWENLWVYDEIRSGEGKRWREDESSGRSARREMKMNVAAECKGLKKTESSQ